MEHNFETNANVSTHFYGPWSRIGCLRLHPDTADNTCVVMADRRMSKRRNSFQNFAQKWVYFTIISETIFLRWIY